MTNVEARPEELVCETTACAEAIDIITPRDVPLGGPRAMTVRRTLPQRKRSFIGPWCFVDHFGPDDVAISGGMQVARHPHTGLATVTLLFEGTIEHIDSTGFSNVVKPGEVNLMIAASGVSHSEYSSATTVLLHGVQLWYALPDALRNGMPQSQHFVAEPVAVPGGTVLTYLGEFAGRAADIDTRVPALAAEVRIHTGQEIVLDLDPTYEHGVLLDSGDLEVEANGVRIPVGRDELAYLPVGPTQLRLRAGSDGPVRAVVIGGAPFGEPIVMWWNFIGRTHEEIVAYREAWMAEIGRESVPELPDPGETYADGTAFPRFGTFPADTPAPLPAPVLPNVRIRPRG
ncbi:pirin family protein [Brevibacterium samyangense]|uniref:Pirin family protein n=1 Tax=Brevibacterium samyangense TaxID=366888 RepID=A0ABN2T9K3_9MICO